MFTVPWADLDRSFPPDHLTTLWLPALSAPVGRELVGFHELLHELVELGHVDAAVLFSVLEQQRNRIRGHDLRFPAGTAV